VSEWMAGRAVEGLHPDIIDAVLGDNVKHGFAIGMQLHARVQETTRGEARIQRMMAWRSRRGGIHADGLQFGRSLTGNGIVDVSNQGQFFPVTGGEVQAGVAEGVRDGSAGKDLGLAAIDGDAHDVTRGTVEEVHPTSIG
jgi:hypothetical protein